MHTYTTLGMLALAGAAMAAPHYGRPRHQGGNPYVVYETAVVTVIVGPDGQPIEAAQPTPALYAPSAPAPAQPTSYYVEVPQESKPAPEPTPTPEPAPASPKPSAEPTPSSSAAPAPPADGDYMSVVKEWRNKLGLSELAHDTTLESNAVKTCNDGNGQMVHELNPGTFGQVLAPGEANEFERVFVGGWLCEIPTLPGLGNTCQQMSDGWAYNGQTGHADILTSPDYTKIGCGYAKGIWGCDVA